MTALNASKNFLWSELACKCPCRAVYVDQHAIDTLQKLREHLGVPLKITSACRCPEHNKAVGGVPNSYHIGTPEQYSRAFDIAIPKGMTAEELMANAKWFGFTGIILYNRFVHCDTRPMKYFEDKRK